MEQYSKNIRSSSPLEGLSVHSVQTSLQDLVSLELGFVIPPLTASVRDSIVASLTAELLDAGTKKHSKDALRKLLEERGASVTFSHGPKWLLAHAQCLKEDVALVLSLIGEMMQVPVLAEKELATVQKREYTELQSLKSVTGARANRGLRGEIFTEGHPYWAPSIEVEQRNVLAVRAKELQGYHKKSYSRDTVMVVAVGDVNHRALTQAAEKAFVKMKRLESAYSSHVNTKKRQHYRGVIVIPDQASVDLRMGHALSLTRSDPRYYPLVVLMDMLGGGFAAHLMQTVRERDGLTYGIYAGLNGFTDGNEGWWQIGGTFAPALYKKGEETTLKEVELFLSEGVTADAVESKKEEILGTYKIGLATSQGLASTILFGLEEGMGTEHVDSFVTHINSVSVHDVERVRDLIDLKAATLVAAGSIDEKGNPL